MIGESFFTIQANSAIGEHVVADDLDVGALLDRDGDRAGIGLAIGATPAIALRTDVPPPCDEMMPVTSAPSSLK